MTPQLFQLEAPVHEAFCACDEQLETPHERRQGKCYECERMDERMSCAQCEDFVGIAYCDGSPTFCSDACEEVYWNG